MKEKILKFLKSGGYVILFFISFVFFIYLTFPYGVLKETIASKMGKATGLTIRIDEFGPALPLGIYAEGVKISETATSPGVELKSMKVKLGLLNLLIGSLAMNVHLESTNKGELQLYTRSGLLRMITEQNPIPSRIMLESKGFAIGHLIDFLLGHAAADPTANPLVAGLLSKIHFKGDLQGSADLDLDLNNIIASSGEVNFDIKNANLNIDDPALKVAPQSFSKAAIKAKMVQGKLAIDKASGLKSQEMDMGFDGKVDLKKDIARSPLDVNLSLQLHEGLKENFGFLLDMGGGKEGSLKMKVQGTLGAPATQAM